MYELNACILYPEYLNLSGDSINMQILQKRMEWRGHKINLHSVPIGKSFQPALYDLIFLGNGTDTAMRMVLDDFKDKSGLIKEYIETDKVLFAVSAGFQLLGNYYVSLTHGKIDMTGLLDFYTREDSPRIRGNLSIRRMDGSLVTGFENHKGRTYLGANLKPFGMTESGFGNNGEDSTEGVHYKNVFGTYCHGPALATAPEFADELLRLALNQKYGHADLSPLDDTLERDTVKAFLKTIS